jgi:hypothetical protein
LIKMVKPCRVFAEETSADGRRKFIITTPSKMWAVYQQLKDSERHYYEIIREGRPCHLYFGGCVLHCYLNERTCIFSLLASCQTVCLHPLEPFIILLSDLEYDPRLNPGLDGNSMVEALIDVVKALIKVSIATHHMYLLQ